MPYEFQETDALLKITLRGKVTGDEIMRMLTELAQVEARSAVAPDRITYMAAVEDVDFTYPKVDGFARERAKAQLPNVIRSAFVAPTDLHFGFARMLQTLNTNPKIQIKAFRDEPSAMQWLQEIDRDRS